MDVDARMQLFDLKTKYQFETIPGVCEYNMPLYSAQTEPGGQVITPFPVYQGLMGPCYVNGVNVPFYTQRDLFFRTYPNTMMFNNQVATGDGVTTDFEFLLPYSTGGTPGVSQNGFWQNGVIPGHVDMTGIIATGTTEDPIFTDVFPVTGTGAALIPSTSIKPNIYITTTNENGSNTVIADSGIFLESGSLGNLYGLLYQPGNPPNGDSAMPAGYSTTLNTVNYNSGVVNVTFPTAPIANAPINAQCIFYQSGLPRAALFFNNTVTLRVPPNTQYLIEFDAYLTPAAMLSTTTAIPFAYMAEYIARGAARKILSDTGDWEQFTAYEPLFIEQERLVWKRSQRIFTSTRTATIFSEGHGEGGANNMGMGNL